MMIVSLDLSGGFSMLKASKTSEFVILTNVC